MSGIIPFLPSIVSAIGSIGSGLMSGKGKETDIQGKQRSLIDELLRSVKGQGQYSDLFNFNEDAFQRAYGDPARQHFRDKTTPQIQQGYISSGQQRGTPLEDTLTRAGVDMDQLLNQQRFQSHQGMQNRQMDALSSILSQGPGEQQESSFFDKFKGAASGYLSGEAFPKDYTSVLDVFTQRRKDAEKKQNERKGFDL